MQSTLSPQFPAEDMQIHQNVLILKYNRLLFNLCVHGFEKGVLPILEGAIRHGTDTLVLDMDETEYVEPNLFGAILTIQHEVGRMGFESIRILKPSSSTIRVYDICGFDKVFGRPFMRLDQVLTELPKNSDVAVAA